MITRIVLGTTLLVLLAGLFALDYVLGIRTGISALIFIAGTAGWCELGLLGGVAKASRGGGKVLFAIGLAGTSYFLALGWSEAASGSASPLLLGGGLAALLFLLFSAVLFRTDYLAAFHPLLVTLLGVLLFGLLFSYLFRIYHLEKGSLIGAVYILGIKGNDIAAYFTGRLIGRRRFLKVSPNKTLEGCAAAVIFSALWFTAAAAAWPGVFFPWPWGIPVGIILSVATQVGDLSESLIKRVYQVKDSARLIPEFGGVLDLIDSALFSGFLFWVLLASFA